MDSKRDPKPAELELELDVPVRPARGAKAKIARTPEDPVEIALDYGPSAVSSGSMPTKVRSQQSKAPSSAREARDEDVLAGARDRAQYGEDPRGVFAAMRYVVTVYRQRTQLVNQLAQHEERLGNLRHTRDATLVSIGTQARQTTLGVERYLDVHEQLARTERTAAMQEQQYAMLEQGHLTEMRAIDANLVGLESAYQDAARDQQASAQLAAELQRECQRFDAKQKRLSIELRNVAASSEAPPPSADVESVNAGALRATASFNEALDAAKRAASIADEQKARWQRAQAERGGRQTAFARASAPVTQALGQVSQERTHALCTLARRALADEGFTTPELAIATRDLDHQDRVVTTAEAERDQLKLAVDSYDRVGLRRGVVAWGAIAGALFLMSAAVVVWRAW